MKDRDRDEAALRRRLERQHRQFMGEIEAAEAEAAALVGFTRDALLYVVGSAYDMALSDLADGEYADQAALLRGLAEHMEQGINGLLARVQPGVVIGAPEPQGEQFGED